jgi:hypothetical protein
MENFEEFEELLRQRSYAELTDNEKQWVTQFISSEAEYESLRQADKQLNHYIADTRKLTPSPKIWAAIKNDIAQNKKAAKGYWLNTPVPAYATFLLLMVVGLFSWYGGSNYNSTTVYAPKVIAQIDTVFIASKPDTIVRERIIYLKASPAPAITQTSTKQSQDVPYTKGINMKEKEELERLLVSGSR